ncbi:MAG: DNA-directed RNA polymerase subunit K [Methanobacteriota archaeon]
MDPAPVARLTRFERARIIGARALQISMGAPILVEKPDLDPVRSAELEFRANLVPITVHKSGPRARQRRVVEHLKPKAVEKAG